MSDATEPKQGLFTRRRIMFGCGGLIVLLIVCAVFGVLVGEPPESGEEAQIPEGGLATSTVTAVSEEEPLEPGEAEEPAETPHPSATPEPTATPAPTTTPTAMPEPLILTGSGTRISEDFSVDASTIIVRAQHTGGNRNFIVTLKDAETGEPAGLDALLVNTIGAYQGENVASIDPGTYYFEVDADGNWETTVRLPGHLERYQGEPPYEFTGTGDSVIPLFVLGRGRLNFELQHNGNRNFIVAAYNVSERSSGTLIVNEIGAVDMQTTEQAGDGWHMLDVKADGEWVIRVGQ